MDAKLNDIDLEDVHTLQATGSQQWHASIPAHSGAGNELLANVQLIVFGVENAQKVVRSPAERHQLAVVE